MWQTKLIHNTQNYSDSNKYWAKKNLDPTKSKAETVVALETDLMITTSMCVLL